MPVVIGGWDSPESFLAAIKRGEIPNEDISLPDGIIKTEDNEYVELADTEYIATSDKGSILKTNVLGVTANPIPGVMVNAVLAGVWSGFNPNDIAGGLAIIRAYSLEVYGSTDLGTVRYSSEVLENEPTGVRPGTMERIVIPAWARRERGSPL